MAQASPDEELTDTERTALLNRFETQADQAVDDGPGDDPTKASNKVSVDGVRSRLEGMDLTHSNAVIQGLQNMVMDDKCDAGMDSFADCRDAVIAAASILDRILFVVTGTDRMIDESSGLSEAELNLLNQPGGTPVVMPTTPSATVAKKDEHEHEDFAATVLASYAIAHLLNRYLATTSWNGKLSMFSMPISNETFISGFRLQPSQNVGVDFSVTDRSFKPVPADPYYRLQVEYRF